MATRELLRRAALATPLLGGILILGLLALSVARGPSRPDTVVGSTTTVGADLPVAAASEEVAAGSETVTAGPETGAEHGDHADVGSSDPDPSPAAHDDVVTTGDGRRTTTAAAEPPPPGDHPRPHPRHAQPERGDDDRRGDRPEHADDEPIEIAVGRHDSARPDHEGHHSRHDGTVSVDVGVGPLHVSANLGRPPASRTPTPHRDDRAPEPDNARKPGPKTAPAAKPSSPPEAGPTKSSSRHQADTHRNRSHDHRDGTRPARSPDSVIFTPVLPPGLQSHERSIDPPGEHHGRWTTDDDVTNDDDPTNQHQRRWMTDDDTSDDRSSAEHQRRGVTDDEDVTNDDDSTAEHRRWTTDDDAAEDRSLDDGPVERIVEDATRDGEATDEAAGDVADPDAAPDAPAPAKGTDDDADVTAPTPSGPADPEPAVEAVAPPAKPAAPPAVAEDTSPDPAPAAVEEVATAAAVPVATPAVQDSGAPADGCTDGVGVPPEHIAPTGENA